MKHMSLVEGSLGDDTFSILCVAIFTLIVQFSLLEIIDRCLGSPSQPGDAEHPGSPKQCAQGTSALSHPNEEQDH